MPTVEMSTEDPPAGFQSLGSASASAVSHESKAVEKGESDSGEKFNRLVLVSA